MRHAVLAVALVALPLLPSQPQRGGSPYLGQEPPGLVPALFAPGTVSTGRSERDPAISPNGDEFYFSVTLRSATTIMVARRGGDGAWQPPEVASFAADASYLHAEPCLTHDGRRVFFLSNRPRPGEAPRPGWALQHIWAADRRADGTWGQPYEVGPPINTADWTFFPSVTRDGTLYFTRSTERGQNTAIYRATLTGGRYAEPERLPDAVNARGTAVFNGFIAADESYLVAGVDGREDSDPPGQANYVVFFRCPNGTWTSGVNMGGAVNARGNTVHSPHVSPDGRYFFFASDAPRQPGAVSLAGGTLQLLQALAPVPRSGNSDIYWVSADLIERLRDVATRQPSGSYNRSPSSASRRSR